MRDFSFYSMEVLIYYTHKNMDKMLGGVRTWFQEELGDGRYLFLKSFGVSIRPETPFWESSFVRI